MPTEYKKREPRGFARQEFGQPSSGDKKEDKEFRTKGFGDPTTKYEVDNDD